MAATAASAMALLGALWIALGFLAFALFTLLTPATGVAGAAALTAAAYLVLVAFGALLLARKAEAARRTALMAGLASSGVANLALGLVAKRPLLALGLGGALAAFLFGRNTDTKG